MCDFSRGLLDHITDKALGSPFQQMQMWFPQICLLQQLPIKAGALTLKGDTDKAHSVRATGFYFHIAKGMWFCFFKQEGPES